MGLRIQLQTERGEVLEVVDDPKNLLHAFLPGDEEADYPLTGGIDWYGDTVFNQQQMARFLAEWQRLVPAAQALGGADLHRAIEAMGEKVRTGSHLYLKFVGD
jgi:hypothetical protein